MRRLVRSRSFDVITCPAVHRGAGRLPPFATVVRVARIGVSIFSLEQKKKKILSSLSALVLRTSGILFSMRCRSLQPSGPGRPTLRDNGSGLSSSGSVYTLEVFAGETAVLPCPPPPSDPPATITFFKDGKPVINNGI